MRGAARVVMSLVIGGVALVACTWCRPDKPTFGKFIVPQPRPASTTPACSGDTDCITAAANIACAVSAGCVNGQCRFNTATTGTCPCYENDIRWCPTADWDAQFCVRVDPMSTTATQWQVDGAGKPVCGPTQVPCPTGRAGCPNGTVGTKYDLGSHTWVPDLNAPCVASPPCPNEGATRGCPTGDPSCPTGIQTFRGDDWDPECVKPPSCTPVPPPPPPCDPRQGTACGCGGTWDCNGNCSNPGPPGVGQPCGGRCGATLQCDGVCPIHETIIHNFEGQHQSAFGCGLSYNKLKGPKNCGANALRSGTPKVNVMSGSGNCYLVSWDDPSRGKIIWANQACGTDPNHREGNSDIREACNEYFAQGATDPSDQTDCRYIFHVGTSGCPGVTCDLGHDTSECR